MPEAKITYFNTKGLGQGIRMLMTYGGQEFEDIRITMDEWPKIKPSTPFGGIPMVEIDGKKRGQVLAICRFLGRKYGLAGANSEEDLQIDQNIEFFTDIRLKAHAVYFETDEKIKAAKHEELAKNYYPVMIPKLAQIVEENNGHLALGRLTWVDFIFAGVYDAFKIITRIPDMSEKYPIFQKLQDTVVSLPRVKEFCEATSDTPPILT